MCARLSKWTFCDNRVERKDFSVRYAAMCLIQRESRLAVFLALLPLVLGCACPVGLLAEERLGSVSFPNSCAADVNLPLQRAVALLHSFDYENAGQQFADIAKKDPACGIALWGQAMSIYYPLWFEPDEATLKRGRDLLERAQKVGAKTARERDYIQALAVFYQDSSSLNYAARSAAYSREMERIMLRYPQDHEAAIFCALSLLALAPPKDAPLQNRLKAAAILAPLFTTLPDHPGMLHYLIHAYDAPELAARGLPAARRYAQVASSTSHAAHMPSHIFALLGLWQDAIDSNLAAKALARRQGGMLPLHFLDFLHYEYLQIGHEADAQQIIQQIAEAQPKLMPMMQRHALLLRTELPASQALDLHRWSEATSLQPPLNAPKEAQSYVWWATAIGAAHLGDAETARQNLQRSKALDTGNVSDDPKAPVRQLEAEAWIAHAERKNDEAIAKLRQADSIEENAATTAHDWMGAPALEMLGDLLRELNRPKDALAEYEAALQLTPNRFDGLYGAGVSSEEGGLTKQATQYYSKLVDQTKSSASDRPELVAAKHFLAVAGVTTRP